MFVITTYSIRMASLNLSSLGVTTSLRSPKNLNESLIAKSTRTYSATSKSTTVRVFLSYRKADREYVEGLVEKIQQLGVRVFVDYLDEELAETPSTSVANVLRDRMQSCQKLIQLVTPNSRGSIWMPWELGIGDGILKSSNIVILPGTYGSNDVVNSEYFAVYDKIDVVGSSWFVDKVGGKDYSKFEDWLLK